MARREPTRVEDTVVLHAMFEHVARNSKSNVRKSNTIELNPWIEFDRVRQSNEIEHRLLCEFDFRTNRTN